MHDPEGFAGRTAVITGAAGGMGLQIALDLEAAGARVAGIDVKERPAELADALYFRGDVSDERFVGEAIGGIFAASGRLDYLVNAAGILLFGQDTSFVEVDLEVWDRVLAINLTGCMLTARHATPCMQQSGGGAMVHFSSIQCLRGDDRPQDAYQVAKAGILALSRSIAIQFAPQNIRSNVILPGPTESPMQARWQEAPDMKHRTAAAVPLGRVGSTKDMAAACLFLLSDRAAYITGTELIVDGGLMARP
jgi:NAD(P)-dependent dehydrogenase (short-subunit alcohol dehydrogenase family)